MTVVTIIAVVNAKTMARDTKISFIDEPFEHRQSPAKGQLTSE
jgi:hypothetical protein